MTHIHYDDLQCSAQQCTMLHQLCFGSVIHQLEFLAAMVVLKLKTSEGEVFRFRLDRCDLSVVQQYVLTVCEGPKQLVLADSGRPLTDESLQEALANTADGIIRVDIQEPESCDSNRNVSDVASVRTLPSESEKSENTAHLEPSAPPAIWNAPVIAQVVEDPPPPWGQMPQPAQPQPAQPQPAQLPVVQGQVLPQAPQNQQPWEQLQARILETHQLGNELAQGIAQNVFQAVNQHLHRTREHVHRHVQQLSDYHNHQRAMHQEMHRRCAEMHQRAHHHAHAYAQANAQYPQNPPRLGDSLRPLWVTSSRQDQTQFMKPCKNSEGIGIGPA